MEKVLKSRIFIFTRNYVKNSSNPHFLSVGFLLKFITYKCYTYFTHIAASSALIMIGVTRSATVSHAKYFILNSPTYPQYSIASRTLKSDELYLIKPCLSYHVVIIVIIIMDMPSSRLKGVGAAFPCLPHHFHSSPFPV